MTDAPLVHRADERGIAVLTLDSPHNRNALSTRLMDELERALAGAEADPGIRAVLLGHTGGAFCSGADLSEATGRAATAGEGGPGGGGPEEGGPEGCEPAAESGPRRLVRLLRAVVASSKPVVARVDGHVRAGGLGLVGACDIAVAGPRATFAFTEARLALAPAVISLTLLPRLDPRAAARYYLTGERFGAAEAAAIGLVTEAAQDTASALRPVLDGLRAAAPQGLAESKRLVAAEVLRAFDRDAEALVAQSARLFASPQAREGMTAFLERREPRWSVTA